jgi:hypothetical protein
MRKPLYQISQEYMQAFNALYSDEEMPEEAIRDTLGGIEGEFKQKAINTAAIIGCIKADVEAIQEAELRMQTRRKRLERRIAWLENNLVVNMQGLGIEKIPHDEFDITIRQNPVKVIIEATAVIPERYIRTKQVKEPDKTLLKEAIKAGEFIKGVSLIQENKLIIE